MESPNSQHPSLTRKTKAFVDALAAEKAPPLYTLTPEEARKVLESVQAKSIQKPEVDMEDMELAVGPTGKVDTRIVRPKNAQGNLPVILYIHGGGWIMGNKDTHDRLVRELSTGTGAAVVYPNYTPSPEAQYPVPHQQIWTVLEYVVANAAQLRLDAGKLIVAGDSVGGNMAITTSLLAKEKNGPKIAMQLLFYPVTDAGLDTQSYRDFADGPWLTFKAMQWFWDAYLPDKGKRKEVYASPLQASKEQLSGLPPALVITAENDVLRDEGEAFAKKLDEAGVCTSCVRCNGTVHDFAMLNDLAETAPSKTALCLAIAAIKKCLQ